MTASFINNLPDNFFATRFNFIGEYNNCLSNVNVQIELTTEIAADLAASSNVEQSQQLEDSIKSAVDQTLDLQEQKKILEDLKVRLNRREEIPDLVEWFSIKIQEWRKKRETLSDKERYSNNKVYRDFKLKLWQETHPNGETMPDFDQANDDEDIVLMTQTESYICPITVMHFQPSLLFSHFIFIS